jgi:hypothetical protein
MTPQPETDKVPRDGICNKHLIMGCSMCSAHTPQTLDKQLDEILGELPEFECGCNKDRCIICAYKKQTFSAITNLIREREKKARIDELKNIQMHDQLGDEFKDTFYLFYAQERIAELKTK